MLGIGEGANPNFENRNSVFNCKSSQHSTEFYRSKVVVANNKTGKYVTGIQNIQILK
jgi:hypothetical protein